MPKKPLQSLRYMTDFRCIGPECEDHCCRGWDINLDFADYQRVERLRSQSPLVDTHFKEAVVRTGAGKKKKVYAKLNFAKAGGCFFEEGGLCAIHRDFGEAGLPKTCATYPRNVALFGQSFQLSGYLSCPEVARLCLLEEDATELVPYEWDQLPQHIDLLGQSAGDDNDYQKHIEKVRTHILHILRMKRLPVEQRFYLVLYMVRKIAPFYHHEINKDPERRLSQTFARMADQAFQDKILGRMDSGSQATAARNFVVLVLTARDGHANRAKYTDYVNRVLRGYGFANASSLESSLDELWDKYQTRKLALVQRYGQRLDLYFTNYALNTWAQVSLKHEDLEQVMLSFVLSVAVVKFLLYGHPLVPALLEKEEEDLATLDALAVEAIQTFSKNISHNKQMLRYLAKTLQDQGFVDVASLTHLLQV